MFYVEGRHRLAIEPLMLVLAGIGICQVAMRSLALWERVG